MNNVEISEQTVNNYIDNKASVLKDLKVRFKSGSFSSYDVALYDALVNKKDDDKKLTLFKQRAL